MEKDLNKRVDGYIKDLKYQYSKPSNDIWVVNDINNNISNIMIVINHPVIIFRLKVISVNDNIDINIYKTLLELNSTIIHGSYALEENNIILIDTLQVDGMDKNEFAASLESISLTLHKDFEVLNQFIKRN